MPKYLVERQFSVGEQQMADIGRRSREILEQHYPDVRWDHTLVSIGDDERVKTFCLYEAPSEESIRGHARELGMHEVLRISEIVGDVTPADFPA